MTDPKKLTPPADPRVLRQHKQNVQMAGEAMMWNAGFIALPWLKVKHLSKADEGTETYAISADGHLSINPKWYASQRPDERIFELAASMMTFVLRHHDRGVALGMVDPKTGGPIQGQEWEHQLWNRARAMVVNQPLRDDNVGRPPADAIFPPAGYGGSLDAESLYYYLLKNEPKPPPQDGDGDGEGDGQGQQPPQPPHAGGQTQPPQNPGEKEDQSDGEGGDGNAPQTGQPGEGSGGFGPDDIDQMRRAMEAAARQAGTGTHCVEALRPKRERTNYRSVIPAGMDVASTEASERTQNTYGRASRREAFDPAMILPGKIGSDPSVCVVIDFSGSCQHFAQRFADHAQKVATDYPNVSVLLIAHTDRVTFKSWLKPGGDSAKLEEASKRSGGTLFQPAYEAAKEAAKGRALPGGRFDALVHFTDGENGAEWPQPPARRLVVGLTGATQPGSHTKLPCVAKIIPVTMNK